jgi:hypothetical protein
MQCNVGKTDSNIRFILAIAIGALGIYYKSWWGLIGLVPLLTGAFSFCPLYKLIGMNSCTKKSV